MAARLFAYGKVDARKAKQKLARARRRILNGTETSARAIGTYGANYAKQIVPFRSGQTWKSIRSKTQRLKDGTRGAVYIQYAMRQDGGERKEPLSTHDLVGIMHNWSGSKKHFKSGNPKFMDATRNELRKAGVRIAKSTITKIKFY